MISIQSLFDSTYIGGGSSAQSNVISLENLSEEAKLFFELSLIGNGTVTARYMLGTSIGDTFIDPTDGSNICIHNETSGVAGRNFYAISSPILAPFIKVNLTESDGSNVTVSGNLVILSNPH